MSATAQHRLDQENSDERDARLSDMRVRGRQSAIFNDAVFRKMNKKMSNCDFLACPCCNESFPVDNPSSSCAPHNSVYASYSALFFQVSEYFMYYVKNS